MNGVLASLPNLPRKIFARLTAKKLPRHFIDDVYQIETSSRMWMARLRSGDVAVDRSNLGYIGSQPSVVRAAIASIPNRAKTAFIDLGCGKGRVLAIAAEFEFTDIIGIEIAAPLVKIARRNAASVAKLHPNRKPIAVVQGDASMPSLGDSEQVVLFMYNSFGPPIIERLLTYLKQALAESPRKLFMICYNPVQFALFDESRIFSRLSAELHYYTPEEERVAPFINNYDSVIVYQSNNSPLYPALPTANRQVKITVPNYGAEVLV